MRLSLFAVSMVILAANARSQGLSDADREALLEKLENLSNTADARVDARFRTAMSAFTAAMNSDDAAFDLYMKCVEKVDFEDQKKKNIDFREWRRGEEERLSKPSLKLALRHQLRWLVITLQAASEKADREKLSLDAQQVVDAIFRDAEKVGDQQQVLRQGVTESVFARAYEINSIKIEKWSLSPVNLGSVYDEILLPPYRKPERLEGLRSTWVKRMQQEGMVMEFWSPTSKNNRNPENKDEKARIGMADAMRPPEYDKFMIEGLPKLQWEMEVDLFKNGDQAGSSRRMLAHLEKYISHASAPDWTKQFRELLGAPKKEEKPVS